MVGTEVRSLAISFQVTEKNWLETSELDRNEVAFHETSTTLQTITKAL